MQRNRLALFALAGLAGGLSVAAAQQRAPAWAQAQPGLWEISGAPGAKAPFRQCVADIAVLAEFEHRGKNCSLKGMSNSANSTTLEYSCGSAGFGRSQVDVITPRSLRIDTQGISAQLPFSYVLQARRVGDCPAQAAASRH
jgi:uncharacterized protein DUF3617